MATASPLSGKKRAYEIQQAYECLEVRMPILRPTTLVPLTHVPVLPCCPSGRPHAHPCWRSFLLRAPTSQCIKECQQEEKQGEYAGSDCVTCVYVPSVPMCLSLPALSTTQFALCLSRRRLQLPKSSKLIKARDRVLMPHRLAVAAKASPGPRRSIAPSL